MNRAGLLQNSRPMLAAMCAYAQYAFVKPRERNKKNKYEKKIRRVDVTILCCLVGLFVVPIHSAFCSFDSVLDMFVYIQNYYIYLDYAF